MIPPQARFKLRIIICLMKISNYMHRDSFMNIYYVACISLHTWVGL